MICKCESLEKLAKTKESQKCDRETTKQNLKPEKSPERVHSSQAAEFAKKTTTPPQSLFGPEWTNADQRAGRPEEQGWNLLPLSFRLLLQFLLYCKQRIDGLFCS